MAYNDDLAVLRIYSVKDLSSPSTIMEYIQVRLHTAARDIYAPGYVADAPVVHFPTFTPTTNISVLPYNDASRYADIVADWSTTVSEFEDAGFTVGEDEDGWYLELPFEPVDANGITIAVDPTDPAEFSPVFVQMMGYNLTKVWVGATFRGGVYELGQRDTYTNYEWTFEPIELSPAVLPSSCPPFWRAFNNTVEVDLCPEPLPYFKSSMFGSYAPLPTQLPPQPQLPIPLFGSGIEVVTGEWIDGTLVSSSALISGLPAPFMRSTGGTLSFEFSETFSVPWPLEYNYVSGYYAALITAPGGSDPNQTVLVDVYFSGYQPIDQTVLLGVPDVMPPTFIGSPESDPQYLRGMVVTLVAREPGYEFVIGEIYTFVPM